MMRDVSRLIAVCGLLVLSGILVMPGDVSENRLSADGSEVTQQEPLMAYADVDPDTLNLKSNGKWVTAYITAPEGYMACDISAPDTKFEVGGEYGEFCMAEKWDVQGDVLMVKFSRPAVIDAITAMEPLPVIQADVTGMMEDGKQFECKGRWVYTGYGWKYFAF